MSSYLGKHLRVDRGTYRHHGIGDGKGGVIHYGGKSSILTMSAPVERVSLRAFRQGARIDVVWYDSTKYAAQQVVERAESRLGENLYSTYGNNCEHFASWCITGDRQNREVRCGVYKVAAAAAGFLTGGPLGAAIVFAMVEITERSTRHLDKAPRDPKSYVKP